VVPKGIGIEAQELRKRYGARLALDSVNLQARAGEVVGLLGLNGAGKTTTLSILATLLMPDAGTVRIAGLDARTHRAAIRRRLGFVPQSIALYPILSAAHNVEAFLHAHGIRRLEASATLWPATITAVSDCESMGRHHLTSYPLEQNPLLFGAELRSWMDKIVISGRHRTICHDPTDGFELSALSLRTVRWPIGEIQRLPGLVDAEEVRRRQSRIPDSRFLIRVTVKAGACQGFANLRIRRQHVVGIARKLRRLAAVTGTAAQHYQRNCAKTGSNRMPRQQSYAEATIEQD
jgi:ABC-type sugar transport system ATPase subunit